MSDQNAGATRKATLREKLAWGAGGMTESLVNAINMLSLPIFSIALGVSPVLIGLAQSIPRLIDAFTDPIMGNISDNARTRWGRWRPFIFIGAVLVGLSLPLIYMPPRAASEFILFLWFAVLSSLFFVAFTVWSIPWSALGLELSGDYNDRTRLQIFRMIFASIAGVGVAWVYKLCFVFNADEIIGVRYVMTMIGAIMMIMGILSAVCIREWRPVEKQASIRLLPALKMTLSNKPFQLLCLTVLFFAGGMILVEPMLLYVNIYYVFDGGRVAASTIMGISGTIGVVIAALMLPVGGRLSARIGKRRAGLFALVLIMVGKGSQFWLVTPTHPYLQLVCRLIFQPGIMLMWALIPSMIADVCDLDELQSGRRREASFSSVYQWVWKLGATLAMAVGGLLLSLVGAKVSTSDSVLSSEITLRLRLVLSVVAPAFSALAFICLWRYPLSENAVVEIRKSRKNSLISKND